MSAGKTSTTNVYGGNRMSGLRKNSFVGTAQAGGDFRSMHVRKLSDSVAKNRVYRANRSEEARRITRLRDSTAKRIRRAQLSLQDLEETRARERDNKRRERARKSQALALLTRQKDRERKRNRREKLRSVKQFETQEAMGCDDAEASARPGRFGTRPLTTYKGEGMNCGNTAFVLPEKETPSPSESDSTCPNISLGNFPHRQGIWTESSCSVQTTRAPRYSTELEIANETPEISLFLAEVLAPLAPVSEHRGIEESQNIAKFWTPMREDAAHVPFEKEAPSVYGHMGNFEEACDEVVTSPGANPLTFLFSAEDNSFPQCRTH